MSKQAKSNRGQFSPGVSGNPKGRVPDPVRGRRFEDALSHVDWMRLEPIPLDQFVPPPLTKVEKTLRDRMLEAQSECAICDVLFSFGDGMAQNGPCVDHDHVSGKVRGLICQGCNKALGFIKDRPETADRMAAYLRVNKGES